MKLTFNYFLEKIKTLKSKKNKIYYLPMTAIGQKTHSLVYFNFRFEECSEVCDV